MRKLTTRPATRAFLDRTPLVLGLGLGLGLGGCSAGGSPEGQGAASGAARGTGGGASGSGGAEGGASSGPGAGAGGAGAAGGGSGGLPAACDDLPICDGFETVALGGLPDPSVWSLTTPSCSGTGTIAVDSEAHGGAQSVKVSGKGGYCNHVFFANTSAFARPGATEVVYGRFWLRVSAPLGAGHTTFLAMKDDADGGKDLRMGGQNMVLMFNRESDDATLPAMSPAGTAMSASLAASTWTCIELMLDGQGQLTTWVDGIEIAGLEVDGTPTPDVDEQWLGKPWAPSLSDFKLGWESYAGQDLDLWFDDVAVGAVRIGCD